MRYTKQKLTIKGSDSCFAVISFMSMAMHVNGKSKSTVAEHGE